MLSQGFGNSMMSTLGGYYGIMYTIIPLLFGIILIVIGASLLNEKGWVNVNGRLVADSQVECDISYRNGNTKVIKRNAGYKYNIEYQHPESNDWISTSLRSNCFRKGSEPQNPNNYAVNLQYNTNTQEVRHALPSSAGIILIVLGVFLCIIGMLSGLCTMNNDCRMGMGAMGVMSSVFGTNTSYSTIIYNNY